MTIAVAAFLVTFLATGAAIPVLRRARVIDVPNLRSSHRDVIPRGGGVAVLLGLCAGLTIGDLGRTLLVIVIATLLAGALGLSDDVVGLPATTRLAFQVVLASLLAVWMLNEQGYGMVLLIGGSMLAMFWLVAFVNAFNFMDGINGISGLSAGVAGGWYAWVGHDIGAPSLTTAGLALAGASIGFLPWNVPRARVFLGDAGSYGLGLFSAALALLALLQGVNPVMAIAPLTIYVVDTAWALVKRLRRGDPWREAHREHVYQKLVDGGWSHVASAFTVSCAAGAIALSSAVLPGSLALLALFLISTGYLMLPACEKCRERGCAR